MSLKHEFGVGYNLSFTFTGQNSEDIYAEIERRVPGAKFDYREEDKHFFKLSYEESYFSNLLDWLNSQGCSEISLQLTTLEEGT